MELNNYKVIKPEDLNHYGYLFGGKLLQWVDEFSWISASLEYPNCSFVTHSMNNVMFKKSVRQGTILKFNTSICEKGRAYVKYKVSVSSENKPDIENKIIFDTIVTFVSIDEKGKITSIK